MNVHEYQAKTVLGGFGVPTPRGVAVSIPKGKWGVVTPDDLEKATPKIEPNDIVMINTGAHRLYGDNDDYFAY